MAVATLTLDAPAWFPILAKRFDDKAGRVAVLRSYMFEDPNVSPPLPEMGKNTKNAWTAFQKRACPALAPLIVSSAADRIRFAGVVIGEERKDVERLANRIIRDTRFEAVLGEAVHAALTDGESYIMTSRNAAGKAVITAETRQFVEAATDPLEPWRARAAMKVWRDFDLKLDMAYVWDGVNRAQFARPIADEKKKLLTKIAGGAWELVDSVPVDGVPLVVISPSKNGQSAFEPHTQTIDRVYSGILNRLVTAAMQAFQQRFLTGGLPAEDENGNKIDYSKLFESSPGALWDLPDGVDVKSLAQTDIRPMLDASKDDLRDLSAESRTPLASLNPSDGANQSAEGALAAREALVFRVQGYLDRIRPALELAIVRAIRIENPTALSEEDTVTMLFTPPQRISETERFQALTMAKAADIPFRSRMLTIGGFSAEEVDRMEIERLDEQMTLGAILNPNDTAEQAGPVLDPADLKALTDAMGALIRAGATGESAAAAVGLTGIQFNGGIPVSLRMPEENQPAPAAPTIQE